MDTQDPIYLSQVRPGGQGPGRTPTLQIKGDEMMTVLKVMREESLNSVRMLVKLFELKTMNEGKKARIFLFDDRHLDILVQPRLKSTELLDLISSHLNLKEKEFFGLTYLDENIMQALVQRHAGRRQDTLRILTMQRFINVLTEYISNCGSQHWLDLNRRVLEHHHLNKKSVQFIQLHLTIRFYAEGIGCLKDNTTVELFYQHAQQCLFQGKIECDSSIVFDLGGYVMQATHGDFTDTSTASQQLKELNVLPTETLQDHPCISYCEEQIISAYKQCSGQSRGSSIVSYMAIIEDLPTYGIHYHSVKDKIGIPWLIGISYKGISVYDHNDKKVPRRVFCWKQLENIYFRDRKFSIEVHDPRKMVLPRKPFSHSGLNVHSWFTPSPLISKGIWSMAISQHQFFLERINKKKLGERSLQDIAQDITRSSASLCPSGGPESIPRCDSSKSLPASVNSSMLDVSAQDDSGACAALRAELISALKARKEHLTSRLETKIKQQEELNEKENNLLGITVQSFTPVEVKKPEIKADLTDLTNIYTNKHPESCNNLNSNIQPDSKTVEDLCTHMETDLGLQASVASCYYRLFKLSTTSAVFRKSWHQRYCKAFHKLLRIEKIVNENRRSLNKSPCQISIYLNFDSMDPGSAALQARRRSESTDRSSSCMSTYPTLRAGPTSAPNTPLDGESAFSIPANIQSVYRHSKTQSLPYYYNRKSCSLSRFSRIGSYKKAVSIEDDVISPLFSDVTLAGNRRDSIGGNLYNLKTNSTTAYDSHAELRSPTSASGNSGFWSDIDEDCPTSKTGSLDGYYGRRSRSRMGRGSSMEVNSGVTSPSYESNTNINHGLGSSSEKLRRKDSRNSIFPSQNKSNRWSVGSPCYRRKNYLASGESTRLFEFDCLEEVSSNSVSRTSLKADRPFQLSDVGKSDLRFRRKKISENSLKQLDLGKLDVGKLDKESIGNCKKDSPLSKERLNSFPAEQSVLCQRKNSIQGSNPQTAAGKDTTKQHKRSRSVGVIIRRKLFPGSSEAKKSDPINNFISGQNNSGFSLFKAI